MSDVLFSILVPTLPERVVHLAKLLDRLNPQIKDQPVELIIFGDNRKRPLGDKRNLMMDIAQGKYLAHLDDDDLVSTDYVSQILNQISETPTVDVICISSQSDLGDQMPYVVRTSLAFENEDSNIKKKKVGPREVEYRPDIHRKPWHWCIWKTGIAQQGRFPVEFMGEDWVWIQQVIKLCKTEAILDRVLHYYYYRTGTSLS
jgi:glycosyltransferase involved in cell wall biosynthesis